MSELPDFQKFVNRYEKDSAVRTITINVHDVPSKVLQWMKSQNYKFSVLIDDGFAATAGVTGFPTTWFVDANGHLAFDTNDEEVVDLEQEYSWRVEALKRDIRANVAENRQKSTE